MAAVGTWYESDEDEVPDFSKFRTKFTGTCEYCNGDLELDDDMFICIDCHAISSATLDDYNEHTNQLATTKVLSNEQSKQLTREIELMNKNCEQINIRPLPRIVITTAVNIFSELKKCIDETRNKKRRQYIASCIYVASCTHNLLRSKKEIQLFCGLSDRNITTTISEIYVAMNKGIINIEGLKDIRVSFTKSICAKLGIDIKYYDDISADVIYIIDVISANMLITSNFDSKVLGAIYVALRVNGFKVTVKEVCDMTSVNTDTVNKIKHIIHDRMYLFTKLNDRCRKIADDIKQKNNGDCTIQDVIDGLSIQ